MMQILTHNGTGTETVRHALAALGNYRLRVVSTKRDAYKLPMEGLILLGGADISPFFYGEQPNHAQGPDRERDVIEWVLVRRAMNQGVPIMGFCRGHQMIAVAHGAKLHQDMQACAGLHHAYRHTIQTCEPLTQHIPTETVNSLHHQSVASVPPGFRLVAQAEDGSIEAIWKDGVLGVQWHPELLFPYDSRWIGLFDWFTKGLHANVRLPLTQ